MNLIDSHASLQSSHSCKLNTVARVVELTYLHGIVKCESLLDGQGKARCTVKATNNGLQQQLHISPSDINILLTVILCTTLKPNCKFFAGKGFCEVFRSM